MKEIKFRLYAKKSGEMITWEKLKKHFNVLDVLEDNEDNEMFSPFMQYTGLKDKNSVEIYEGDIIKATNIQQNEVIGQVYWNYGCWEIQGYYFKKINNVEVIGNLYENPELIEW